MITIQAEFTQKQCDLGLIGRVGENASRQIVFDCAPFPARISCAFISAPARAHPILRR